MNKVEYLQNFKSISLYSSNIFNAYLQSLTPKQTVQILDLTFQQAPKQRRYILNKILNDSKNKFESFHKMLVKDLIEDFYDLPYKKTNTCGYCLSHLYPSFPDKLKTETLNFFLDNKYVSIRRRGYKILKNNWNKEYKPHIFQNWQIFKDAECAKLIIDNFEINFSQKFLKEFEEVLGFDWYIRKYYLKIAKHDKSILDYIKKVDEITYCYILVKLQKNISEKEARSILVNNLNDERIGLLIWCFGKMKLWDVLLEAEKKTTLTKKYT